MYRIGFVGSNGDFSLLSLHYLLNSCHHLAFIGANGINRKTFGDPRFHIIQTQAQTIEDLAHQYNIPIIDFKQSGEELASRIQSYSIDLLIVACYPRKIPQDILELAHYAAINLHPSLLPNYRGPVPLFWQFRKGLNEYGISLHKMDSDFDQGPIFNQKAIDFPDGISHQQANLLLGKAGTELLDQFLTALSAKQVMETVQDNQKASYMSFPQAKDFFIDPNWSSRHIFNFICGTQNWGKLYVWQHQDQTLLIKEAISYEQEHAMLLESGIKIKDKMIWIQCSPGILKARLA